MVNEELDTNAAAVLLRAVSNPARLRIAICLWRGERSVSELERELELKQPNLSQHLAELRNVNLVATRREAKSVYYRLLDETARRFVTGLLQGLSGSVQEPVMAAVQKPRKRPLQAAVFARIESKVSEAAT